MNVLSEIDPVHCLHTTVKHCILFAYYSKLLCYSPWSQSSPSGLCSGTEVPNERVSDGIPDPSTEHDG